MAQYGVTPETIQEEINIDTSVKENLEHVDDSSRRYKEAIFMYELLKARADIRQASDKLKMKIGQRDLLVKQQKAQKQEKQKLRRN